MSDELTMEDLVRRGEEALAHFGVKGMKWGVHNKRDGGGTVKVKFRPTYTTDERRQAQAAVKTAKKTGSTAVDAHGADLTRLAKMRTPSRRAVNAVLTNKTSLILDVGGLAAVSAALIASGGTASAPIIAGLAVGSGAGLASIGVNTYKVFFQNLVQNPSVKLKAGVTPTELAKYSAGKAFTKEILGKNGSAKITVTKNQTTISVKDREGRSLGSQTTVNIPKQPKPTKPKSS